MVFIFKKNYINISIVIKVKYIDSFILISLVLLKKIKIKIKLIFQLMITDDNAVEIVDDCC